MLLQSTIKQPLNHTVFSAKCKAMGTVGVTERNCRLAGAANSYLGKTGFNSPNEH